jgi:hypothetical protein
VRTSARGQRRAHCMQMHHPVHRTCTGPAPTMTTLSRSRRFAAIHVHLVSVRYLCISYMRVVNKTQLRPHAHYELAASVTPAVPASGTGSDGRTTRPPSSQHGPRGIVAPSTACAATSSAGGSSNVQSSSPPYA